jgi:hypothetical protein
LGTPLKGEYFSSSSDEAFSAKVAADTQPRIRIDAGGRITWGGGSAAGDVYVYRYGADIIKFVGNVAVDALFVDGIEVDTTGATLDQVLKYNGTKFAPGTNVATVASIDAIGDVVITTPTTTQLLKYDGTNWVNSANFTGYDYEVHVSQVDGNDTTGNGDLLTPVASITKALTLVTSQRKTVIIHPGTYTESPSITTQYTTLTGPGLIGGNIVISGTVSTNTGCTISGIKMTNLTVTTPTAQGNVNILNCEVSGTFTKSSNADYTVLRLCDLGAASITGAGLIAIFGGNPNFVTVNNASANVIIKSAVTVSPVLTAGTLSLVDSVVAAAVTNAVTSAASSVITLANCQFLTSALTGVAPVVLNGFYSILNCVYDKPSSTLVASSGTGGTTNSIDYFQYINADKFITQGGTSTQFVKGDGSLASTINLGTDTTGNYVSGVTAGTGVTVTHTPSEGSSPTIAIGQAVATTDSPTFAGATLDAIQVGITATNEIDTTSGNLTIDSAGGTVTIDDNLTVAGNLIVNGTTVTVNSTVTTIDDPVITLGGDTAPSSDDNKDRGVEFRYHTGAAPKIGFFGYDDSTGRFVMIPDATNTSEVFAGTAGDIQATTFFGALSGNASTATTLQSSRTIELTGDVTGSASFNGSANASITATIAANSVALGTDTTGNYMVNVSAGTGITVSHTQGEGSTATVSLNAGLDTLTDVTVTSATTNDFLKYNGSTWVNEPVDLGTDTTGSYVQSLVAGTGVTITNNSGEGTTPTVAIGQAVATTSNVTFNDVTVAGNLNVTGSTFGSATLDVDNYKITLNASVTGAPTLNGEIEVNRGSSTDVRIRWNESLDLWEYTNDGSSYSRIGSALMTVSDTPPSSPYTGDLWFESDSGITFVRYDSFWIEIGASGIGAVTSDTAPSSPANGQIWFESDTNQLKIYYAGTWIQVGGSDAVNVINAINAKGDLVVGTANDTVTRLGVGTNGYVLTANSSTTSGLEWVSRAAIVDDFAVASIMGAY